MFEISKADLIPLLYLVLESGELLLFEESVALGL